MKPELPHVDRLTKEEREVIQCAFNLVHSIVAGDYGMPRPMCHAINVLQDAVHDLAARRGIAIEDGCSKEYLGFHRGYWEGVGDKLKERGIAIGDGCHPTYNCAYGHTYDRKGEHNGR